MIGRAPRGDDVAWNKGLQDGERVVSYPWGIALDLSGGKVHWADTNMDWLPRTGLRGGKVGPVVRIQVPPATHSQPTWLDLGTPR